MSKRKAKLHASSERAAFGGLSDNVLFGSHATSVLFATSSNLSYLAEPPDFSTINRADVRVAFKNLLKKDAITKSKALEELQGYIQSLDPNKEQVEDAVLEAWVCFPPNELDESSGNLSRTPYSLAFPLMLHDEYVN